MNKTGKPKVMVKPIKTGKPTRPGDKLNPLPTVGNKANKNKKLENLKLNIDKYNKAKSPKMKTMSKSKKGM